MLELFVQLFKAVLQLFLALLNPIFLRFCMFCAFNCLDRYNYSYWVSIEKEF